ncbi:MAG: AbrB/MazE/SpoVT family DNA-binding domain-containing protein [Defluviitaleaceae bacterium]|nr:AbrB/MazE/SpoVT family DNA-binding domain-containing protein [Defluviitaleaceae bacterium]
MMQTRETRVNKWGSSLGVRLPREFTELFGIEHKSKVQMEMKNGVLLVMPVIESRKRKPLAEILSEAQDSGKWDGVPDEINPEERQWLDSPSIGAEVVQYE